MTTLPTVTADANRLIKGDLLKCIDGKWTDRDGGPVPETLLVLGRIHALQRWANKKVVGLIIQSGNEPLPAAEALNAEIPQDTWELGLNGKPKPPWQEVWGFYLANPKDAATYTYINITAGARIAYERLNDRIDTMRSFRGADVTPVVKLDNRPMKTEFGAKLRPEFTIVQWVGTGGDVPTIENKPLPAAPAANLKVIPAVTASEEMDDAIPF